MEEPTTTPLQPHSYPMDRETIWSLCDIINNRWSFRVARDGTSVFIPVKEDTGWRIYVDTITLEDLTSEVIGAICSFCDGFMEGIRVGRIIRKD